MIRNASQRGSDGMNDDYQADNEHHEKQFRGWWIPAAAVEMFEREEINAKEMLLLALIDSYQTTRTGCYASNAYLGERLHLRADSVSRMMRRLALMGLIERTEDPNRTRYVQVHWPTMSTGSPDLDAHQEGGGKNAKGLGKNAKGGRQKCLGHLAKMPRGLGKNAKHSNTVYKNSLLEQRYCEPSAEKAEPSKANPADPPDHPPQEKLHPLAELWNDHADRHPGLSRVLVITPERKKKIAARLKDKRFAGEFPRALQKVPIANDERFTWQPDFDWLITNGTNIYKLLEGKYDHREPLRQKSHVQREVRPEDCQ